MRYFCLLGMLVFCGCHLETTHVNRPVKTVVVKPGDMVVVGLDGDQLYLIVTESSLEGRPIKNVLTEDDLIRLGVLPEQPSLTKIR